MIDISVIAQKMIQELCEKIVQRRMVICRCDLEHFKNIHLGKADTEPLISPEGVVKNADKVHGEQHKGIQVQQPGQKPAAALCPGCG